MNFGGCHLVMSPGICHFWLQLLIWNWSNDSTAHKGARKHIPHEPRKWRGRNIWSEALMCTLDDKRVGSRA